MTGLPATLWLVRHGESAGNVASADAEAAGANMIAIEGRDVDVPLSALGERQARALGTWFGKQDRSEQPTVVLSSPYARALQTSKLVLESAGLAEATPLLIDERLR
ncbi:MAG TPA: histidine phosphatase family protein, partial [Polyangiaceae bacterium]|nr:histidine phosphatase family protein [Polyangiaceae bacterium]